MTGRGGTAAIGPRLAEIAHAADEAGFASIWVMDHFFQMGDEFGPADDPMLEGYVAISHVAAWTRRARVGVLVSGNIYRHPGLLVKAVSTLDVLSGGRAYFGIGAGWYEREAHGLGAPFPPLRERFERLEETLQVAQQMWRGDQTPFSGRHYQLAEPINSPQPLSRPHPPILIGGEGERKTLRHEAQYGDACNLHLGASLDAVGGRVERLRHKLAVLQAHCTEVGRPCAEIEKTGLCSLSLSGGDVRPADVIEVCRMLAGLGFEHVIFNTTDAYSLAALETFGREIIPAVRDLS